MEEALELARTKDAKEWMDGVERLLQFLKASKKSLSPIEVASLAEVASRRLLHGSPQGQQLSSLTGALQALSSAAVLSHLI